MRPFFLREILLLGYSSRAVDTLATYNDNGIAWLDHSTEQAEEKRRHHMKKIEVLIAKIGESSLPADFIDAVQSGELVTDMTGEDVDKLKNHFRH